MKIKTIQELDFAAQRAMVGGMGAQGCSCSCTCTCGKDQNSNRIDGLTDDTKNNVVDQMSKKRF